MEIKKTVKNRILKIKKEFEDNHHKFLGEEDIRCHLFSELLYNFNTLEPTEDEKQTIPLHTQLSFFDKERRLKNGEKPDILLIDVPTTNLYSDGKISYKDKASKGFEFEKAPIAIEIKLSWRHRNKTIKNQIHKEIEKIKGIQERNPEIFFYLLYFDKKGRLSEEDVRNINNELEKIEVIYGKGD